MKYNLYFGEGENQFEFKPATPKVELQNLIDNPNEFEKLKQDHKDEVDAITQERDTLAEDKKDLTQDLTNATNELKELTDFLKNELGYNTIDEARADLNGGGLPDILTNAEGDIKTLKANNVKLQNDIGALNTRIGGMVEKAELIKAVEEKNNTITQLGNLGTEHGKLQTRFNNLNNAYTALNNKWHTANFGEIDALITRYQQERNQERKKISDSKTAFEAIVKAVNKKSTAIFGDMAKKNIRKNMDTVKNTLGFTAIDATSDQEDN